ncbi:MAG TPA: PP2C family serine/threonine-protein phosphatase [Oleiagrimonas sp.]|nr:PP2C family serine/threonine-protein phosphatase [Oleiagrimonas sp.]
MIEFGHGTHAGLRRKRNEDTYCADASIGLFLVADGMGGQSHGERAAALARDTISARIRDGWPLDKAVHAAAERVTRERIDTAGSRPMGTTVAAMHFGHDHFQAAWVGDSRIYLACNGQLHQLSHDPSLLQTLMDDGVLDEEETERETPHNMLTRALGMTRPESLEVETVNGSIRPGMRFLLCTDGLTEHVATPVLAATLSRNDIAAQEAVDQLLLAALDAGAHDDVTAIVVRCARD